MQVNAAAMLVDLAPGGWRPGAYRRGIWLFPPGTGTFAWSAIEDAGDGDPAGRAPFDRWHVTGRATGTQVIVDVWREGPGCWGDDAG